MNQSIEIIILLILIFLFSDSTFIVLILFNKRKQKLTMENDSEINKYIVDEIENFSELEKIKEKISTEEKLKSLSYFLSLNKKRFEKIKDKRRLFNQFVNYLQPVSLNNEIKVKLLDYFNEYNIEKYYLKKLSSVFKMKRMESSIYLSYFPNDLSRCSLQKALEKEKLYLVKIYIVSALTNIGDERSIQVITDTLIGSPEWYREKVYVLLSEFGEKFYKFIPSIRNRQECEIQNLIIYFASCFVNEDLKNYLLEKADSPNIDISRLSVKSLAKSYYLELYNEKFLSHPDEFIRQTAILALSNIQTMTTINRLLKFMDSPQNAMYAVSSISEILRKETKFLPNIIKIFYEEPDQNRKSYYANILSNRIEYFLFNLISNEKENIKILLNEIIIQGKTSEIIGFLNKNRNVEIENEILSVIRSIIKKNEKIEKECKTYLNDRILNKLKLERETQSISKKEEKKEKSKIILLYCMLSFLIIIFPILFVIRYSNILGNINIYDQAMLYIMDMNYYLIYYSTSINIIYFIILFFSFVGVLQQIKYWKLKKVSFLFKKNILPSISIIAPAYGEESTIIESANSLLNLKYPDYELIIVNDGSKDKTLETLINYFGLEKVDIYINERINTQPIRGVYTNKSIPKLIVVDKANGGKADSLNSGINVSSKTYFCGIDADSLLEPDALLKIASLTLDSEKETVAMGGNIFPINGCSVDKGVLTKIKIPKNRIARFQTIEYLRAFMAGRIGWAFLNCLLIISGAFGLFKKDKVIAMGGYLTRSGKYKKDTVGEDMELVVRLSSYMRQKKLSHKINYSFNANCWTEVPESFNILYKQRDRWHRGLIDILNFHRHVFFNWKYGSMGLISMPYFLIFEVAGPLIEIQGYLMVILAAVLGMMNLNLVLLLFLSTVFMGIFISVSSLMITEKEESYFSFKEIMILVYYAILENFGFRQVMSFVRVMGYFSSMKKPKGWGKMIRKGFASK
jgi:peptidoglycan-N-acetylglucosamine deacetylase